MKSARCIRAGSCSSRHAILLVASCGWPIAAGMLTGCHSLVQYISPRVEGRVLDAQTHQPLADTRVEKLSHKRNPNPAEPPKGAQVLTQHNAIFTGADGTFVLDSQKAIALFRSGFWYSVSLSFQHAGYQTIVTNYTPASATNTDGGEPLVEAGDILLVRSPGETPATNSQSTTTTNIQFNPAKE